VTNAMSYTMVFSGSSAVGQAKAVRCSRRISGMVLAFARQMPFICMNKANKGEF
jgi:hypothetical protein